MKAKKRTVWFLTLLSICAVAAVFVAVDPTRDFTLPTIFSGESLDGTKLGLDGEQVPVTTDNHLFDQMRMELSNARSQLRELYFAKMASEQISAEEISETYDLINYLIEQESQEAMAEMQIESMGYADAFVKVSDHKINVTVMADELSNEKINEIVYMMKTEINEMATVSVSVKSEYY